MECYIERNVSHREVATKIASFASPGDTVDGRRLVGKSRRGDVSQKGISVGVLRDDGTEIYENGQKCGLE